MTGYKGKKKVYQKAKKHYKKKGKGKSLTNTVRIPQSMHMPWQPKMFTKLTTGFQAFTASTANPTGYFDFNVNSIDSPLYSPGGTTNITTAPNMANTATTASTVLIPATVALNALVPAGITRLSNLYQFGKVYAVKIDILCNITNSADIMTICAFPYDESAVSYTSAVSDLESAMVQPRSKFQLITTYGEPRKNKLSFYIKMCDILGLTKQQFNDILPGGFAGVPSKPVVLRVIYATGDGLATVANTVWDVRLTSYVQLSEPLFGDLPI